MQDFIASSKPDIVKVHELRKSPQGREMLRGMGRKKDVPTGGLGEFIAWDGEGITVKGKHNYVLMGNSKGKFRRTNWGRLRTFEIFNLMLETESEFPDAIHCAFAFNYDVEKICADIPSDRMARLYEEKTIREGPYRIQYYPSKWFQVSGYFNKKWRTCRIWDMFGFFQTSFVNSLRNLFGKLPEFDVIESGKDARNSFRYDQLDEMIIPYWESELVWMVKIADHLRELLHKADMPISQWHGPGAIASYLFRRNRIEPHMDREIPEPVAALSRRAFAGGRFEPFTIGRAGRRVYQYDINSAHPFGMAMLPSLQSREWVPVTTVGEVSDFGVYNVHIDIPDGDELAPMPFFHRDKMGLVRYPMEVSGCYWTPEILAAQRTEIPFEIVNGFELVHDGSRPFEFIHDMYQKRRVWKAQGEAAQMALKLGLNSLFGKTAQRVGWTPKDQTIPRWHQLEWAGYITSNTRAVLWEALVKAFEKGSLISVDTDAVFSLEPLELPCGTGIGEWEYDLWDDMVYLQNGIYWLKRDGKWKSKFRGLDKDSLNLDDVLSYFDGLDFRQHFDPRSDVNPYQLSGKTTRFISTKYANHANREDLRGNWVTNDRAINVGTEGKRIHLPHTCYACEDPYIKPSEGMHDLTHDRVRCGESQAHHIPWVEYMGDDPWLTMDPIEQPVA